MARQFLDKTGVDALWALIKRLVRDIQGEIRKITNATGDVYVDASGEDVQVAGDVRITGGKVYVDGVELGADKTLYIGSIDTDLNDTRTPGVYAVVKITNMNRTSYVLVVNTTARGVNQRLLDGTNVLLNRSWIVNSGGWSAWEETVLEGGSGSGSGNKIVDPQDSTVYMEAADGELRASTRVEAAGALLSTDVKNEVGLMIEDKHLYLRAPKGLIQETDKVTFGRYVSTNTGHNVSQAGEDRRKQRKGWIVPLASEVTGSGSNEMVQFVLQNVTNERVGLGLNKAKEELFDVVFDIANSPIGGDGEIWGYTIAEVFVRMHCRKKWDALMVAEDNDTLPEYGMERMALVSKRLGIRVSRDGQILTDWLSFTVRARINYNATTSGSLYRDYGLSRWTGGCRIIQNNTISGGGGLETIEVKEYDLFNSAALKDLKDGLYHVYWNYGEGASDRRSYLLYVEYGLNDDSKTRQTLVSPEARYVRTLADKATVWSSWTEEEYAMKSDIPSDGGTTTGARHTDVEFYETYVAFADGLTDELLGVMEYYKNSNEDSQVEDYVMQYNGLQLNACVSFEDLTEDENGVSHYMRFRPWTLNISTKYIGNSTVAVVCEIDIQRDAATYYEEHIVGRSEDNPIVMLRLYPGAENWVYVLQDGTEVQPE